MDKRIHLTFISSRRVVSLVPNLGSGRRMIDTLSLQEPEGTRTKGIDLLPFTVIDGICLACKFLGLCYGQ